MSFDGVFTHTMVAELQNKLLSGRITKIQQPFALELLLTIRSFNHNYNLLLSANPNYARVQITQNKFVSPPQPSNFVMTLRKHLAGAFIKNISQIKNDRIIVFSLENHDELGDRQNYSLYVEIMNRHSNIILVNNQDQQIIDSLKHIGLSQDRYRQLLPHLSYKLPPQPKLNDPFDIFAREKFVKDHTSELVAQNPAQTTQLLKDNFMGLGKDTLQELTLRLTTTTAEPAFILRALNETFNQLHTPQACIYSNEKRQIFTPISFQSLQKQNFTVEKFDSLSTMLDIYYQDRARQDRVRQQADNLLQVIKRNLKRDRLKSERLKKDLQKTSQAPAKRLRGELLTTFMSQVPQGAKTVTLPNYYENNQPLTIALKPDLSPSKNAQRYFKTYQKLKNSTAHLKEQLELTQQESAYFESILAQMEYAQPQDLADITLELQQQGYLKAKKKTSRKSTKVRHGDIFKATDGTEIHVGKNNLQNDYLTMKYADKRYTWLHIKNLPGSHVIIAALHPSADTIKQAAQLAAFYSKAGKNPAKVPVDYTLVKHVHKPKGAKPGFVIYTDQKTLLVVPQNNLKPQ